MFTFPMAIYFTMTSASALSTSIITISIKILNYDSVLVQENALILSLV